MRRSLSHRRRWPRTTSIDGRTTRLPRPEHTPLRCRRCSDSGSAQNQSRNPSLRRGERSGPAIRGSYPGQKSRISACRRKGRHPATSLPTPPRRRGCGLPPCVGGSKGILQSTQGVPRHTAKSRPQCRAPAATPPRKVLRGRLLPARAGEWYRAAGGPQRVLGLHPSR